MRIDDIGRSCPRILGTAAGLVLALFAGSAAPAADPSAPSRQRAAGTPGELADQFRELRIYLTHDLRRVRTELVMAGRTRLTELRVPLENGVVRFTDDGSGVDRVPGDGVFTASYAMDAEAEFRRLRAGLRASSDALLGDGTAWITRGPRDTVRARDALYDLRAAGVNLEGLREKTAAILQARSALDAFAALKLDPDTVPLFRQNTGRFDRLPHTPFRLLEVPFFKDLTAQLQIPIDHQRSLMVRATGVVDDPLRTYDACSNTGTPGGPWSFGHLMREMSQGTGLTPEEFVLQWLGTWQSPQTVNEWLIDDPVRSAAIASRVIAQWQTYSGASLDVDKFPARLFAIVNRPDLADKVGYGNSGTAGEGRFVFGLYEDGQLGCKTMRIMVIFEYGISGGSCSTVKAWHQRWKDLDAFAPGSFVYNFLLEGITRDFTDAGSNPAQLPNQSALNQLRVNEVGLHAPDPWQLREFQLLPGGTLGLATVAQTPDDSFNLSATLDQYLAANATNILLDKHTVPLKFPTQNNPFRGVTPEVPNPSTGTFWNADVSGLVDGAEVRRKFSLNTCNACHARETDTFFTHVGDGGSRGIGMQAQLSEFLVGTVPWFTEPVTGQNIHYDDLEEREERMSDILLASCTRMLAFRKVSKSH